MANLAKYKGVPVEGRRWNRSWRVTMFNPYGGAPSVQFDEEQITEIEGNVASKQTETLSLNFNPAGEVPLVNPETGEATGAKMTQADIFVALYSVYRMLADERDKKVKE